MFLTKSIYVYENICFKSNKENVPNDNGNNLERKPQYDSPQFCYVDLLISIKAQLLGNETPWKLTFESQNHFDLSLYDKKSINAIRAFKVLKVFNNLTWVASYAGHQAIESVFSNVPGKISSLNDFLKIIHSLENSNLCTGVLNKSFEVLPPETRNIQNEIIGSVQSVTTVDNQGTELVSNVRRSTSCTFFIGDSSLGSRCSYCNLLRRNLSVQMVRFSNGNGVNGKKVLSDEEKREREQDLKRRLINAEKREKYWRFKAGEMKKMKDVTKDNEDDFLEMFVQLDKGKGPDGEEMMFPDNEKMNMFWEMQREAVSKADQKTSIRWHPQ